MTTKIGNIFGLDVWVQPAMPAGLIEFRNGALVVMRFSVDHPYIIGTGLERTARAALATEANK